MSNGITQEVTKYHTQWCLQKYYPILILDHRFFVK